MPAYGMSVRIDAPLDQALDRARAALSHQGFGILTEIDVAATLKAKLDVDVPPQIILGACNAPLARQGLQIEPDLGLLLPATSSSAPMTTDRHWSPPSTRSSW